MRNWMWLLICSATVPAYAYELTGSSWRMSSYSNGVPYCPVVNAKDATTTGQQQAFATAVDAGLAAWSQAGAEDAGIPGIPCSAFVCQKSTCTGSPSQSDQQHWVYWEADWASVPGVGASTIGVTPWWSSGAEIVNAKVIFNDRDYTWSTDGSATDVGSIAVHEFGHFVGLDHYDDIDPAKATACHNASPPSVMCSYYSGGVSHIPTADDAIGVCYLYPQAGAVGSGCSTGASCNSGICHSDGYCSVMCPPTCPSGYSCLSGLCERDQPLPTCPPCGTLACSVDSVCLGTAEGSSVCTEACSRTTDCPVGYSCAAAEGSTQRFCWPLGNLCGATGPHAGEACSAQSECAFGNICLSSPTHPSDVWCYGVCRVQADCADPAANCVSLETGVGYCDRGAAVCVCDTDAACQTGCACDVDCDCACDQGPGCETDCSCDSACVAAVCACDVSVACDDDCEACDPECGGCNCMSTLTPWASLTAMVLLGLGGWVRCRRRYL